MSSKSYEYLLITLYLLQKSMKGGNTIKKLILSFLLIGIFISITGCGEEFYESSTYISGEVVKKNYTSASVKTEYNYGPGFNITTGQYDVGSQGLHVTTIPESFELSIQWLDSESEDNTHNTVKSVSEDEYNSQEIGDNYPKEQEENHG